MLDRFPLDRAVRLLGKLKQRAIMPHRQFVRERCDAAHDAEDGVLGLQLLVIFFMVAVISS